MPHVNLSISCSACIRAALEIAAWMWSSAAAVCPFSVVLLQVAWRGDPEHSGSCSTGVSVCRCSWQCQCVLPVHWKPRRLCTAGCNLLQSVCSLTLWYQNRRICAHDSLCDGCDFVTPFALYCFYFIFQHPKYRLV